MIRSTKQQKIFDSGRLSTAYGEDQLFVSMKILSIQTPHLVVMATYFTQTKVHLDNKLSESQMCVSDESIHMINNLLEYWASTFFVKLPNPLHFSTCSFFI